MSRSFTVDMGDQRLDVPADGIFNSLPAMTLAAWVKISSYGSNGGVVIVRDPTNYNNFLAVAGDGTLSGGAGGVGTIGPIASWSINAGGLGYANGDVGHTTGAGTEDAPYQVFNVGGGGVVTDGGVSPSGPFGDGFSAGQVVDTVATSGIGVGLKYNIDSITSNPATAQSNEMVSLDTWTHLALTWNSGGDGKVHLYLNGVEVTYVSQTVQTTVDPSTSGWIIANDGFGSELLGLIAEMVIYDSALSSGQIATLAASMTGATGSPIGYWHLCGSISPEPDSSGNGNDAVLSGTPLPGQGENSPGYVCSSSGGAGAAVCIIGN